MHPHDQIAVFDIVDGFYGFHPQIIHVRGYCFLLGFPIFSTFIIP